MTQLTAASLHARARQMPGDAPSSLGLPMDDGWREVATLAPTNEDGHEVVIYVQRAPALFWRVAGGGVDLSTGSSAEALALSIAEAIAEGMLGPTTKNGAN